MMPGFLRSTRSIIPCSVLTLPTSGANVDDPERGQFLLVITRFRRSRQVRFLPLVVPLLGGYGQHHNDDDQQHAGRDVEHGHRQYDGQHNGDEREQNKKGAQHAEKWVATRFTGHTTRTSS